MHCRGGSIHKYVLCIIILLLLLLLFLLFFLLLLLFLFLLLLLLLLQVGKQLPLVYNGYQATGIRSVSCLDVHCQQVSAPITIQETDSNPRYIRMELTPPTESTFYTQLLPTMVYAATGSTQMKATVCIGFNHDPNHDHDHDLCHNSQSIVFY